MIQTKTLLFPTQYTQSAQIQQEFSNWVPQKYDGLWETKGNNNNLNKANFLSLEFCLLIGGFQDFFLILTNKLLGLKKFENPVKNATAGRMKHIQSVNAV